ncbi:putative ribokinase [Helianthus anomalus]
MTSLSPATPWQAHSRTTANHPTINLSTPDFMTQSPQKKSKRFPSFTLNSTAKPSPPPLVVVGSANADIYVEIERLPKEGETISATTGQTLAGGKGANQAVCGGMLSYPTYFVGRVGNDAHGKLIIDALVGGGVVVDYVEEVGEVPTGHAVSLGDGDLEVVKSAGIVLLQREIPDGINVQVAKAARSAGVPVILDAGGMDAPVPVELLRHVDILSPNESELARLTGMPTETFEQISLAVAECHKLGVKEVLVKLGGRGSVLFSEGKEPIKQGIIAAEKVLDTTGAGDTFTAAYAVAFVEGKSKAECLRFAAAAASLCVQVKGAIPSMPRRKAVLDLLQFV